MPRSLSPAGLSNSMAKLRLASAPNLHDPELLMSKLWAEENKPNLAVSFGLVPVHLIAHRCTSKCKGGSHRYRPVERKDIRLISSTVQWLATPIGRSFLTKFFKEIGCEIVFDTKLSEAKKEAREAKQRKKRTPSAKAA